MNTPQNDTAESPTRWQRFQNSVVWEYIQVAVVAFVLVFGFIRPFIIEPFKIPSGSMENTLLVGDRILVCKFIYGIKIPGTDIKLFDFHKPARGDVFVFIPPHEKAKNFIKRAVAVGGDTVETRGDTLRVNGKAIDDGNYAKHMSFPYHRRDFPPFLRPQYVPDGGAFVDFKLSRDRFRRKFPNGKPFSVPDGFVFAMGDNRDQSSDSRNMGAGHAGQRQGTGVYGVLVVRQPRQMGQTVGCLGNPEENPIQSRRQADSIGIRWDSKVTRGSFRRE